MLNLVILVLNGVCILGNIIYLKVSRGIFNVFNLLCIWMVIIFDGKLMMLKIFNFLLV